MSVLVVEVDVLAYLTAFDQLAHWKMVDIAVVPVPVDLGRQTDVNGAASPTFHPVVKNSLFLTHHIPIALKPRVFYKLKRLIPHMK